jgi:hypothetical protein
VIQTSIKMKEGIDDALVILMDKIVTLKAFNAPVI